MAWFSKDNTEQPPENELMEDVNIDFSPLWQDEEASSLAAFIVPGIQIILLIVLIFMVKGLH